MTETIQEQTQVTNEELKELYAKAYAYKKAQEQIDSPELAGGYLKYLAETPEELMKLKVAYGQMYPTEQKGNQVIDMEIKKTIQFNPFELFLPLKKILLKTASLYGTAFRDFLEKLTMDEESEKDWSEEEPQKFETSMPEQQVNPVPKMPSGFGAGSKRRVEAPRQIDNEKTQKNKSILKRLFGAKKQVEKINLKDIVAEREKMGQEQTQKQQQSYDAQKLEAYNARVKARALANMAREGFSNQITNVSVMQKGA